MAYHSNSADDRLAISSSIPSWAVLSTDDFTMMGWFKWDGSTGSGLKTIFTRYRNDLSAYIWFGVFDSGQLYYENSQSDSITGSTFIVADTWYHFTFVYAPNVGAQIYVNAVSDGSGGAGGIAGLPERMDLLGWVSAGNRWNGHVAAVKAWNRVLTQPQIAAEKNVAAPVDTSGLYDNWLLQTNVLGSNGHNWTIIGDPDVTADPPITYPSAGSVEIAGTSSFSFSATGSVKKEVHVAGSSAVQFTASGQMKRTINIGGLSAMQISANGVVRLTRLIGGLSAVRFNASGHINAFDPSIVIPDTQGIYIEEEIRGIFVPEEIRGVYVS